MLGLLGIKKEKKINEYKREFKRYMKMNPDEFKDLSENDIKEMETEYIARCVRQDSG